MSALAFLDTIPVWLVGVLIFVLRVVDVSIGTIRTISVVQGRARFAVVLGFFEVMVWVVAVGQVVARLSANPWLVPFYAGGYSAGVGVGMLIERRLALGRFVIRIISRSRGREIGEAINGRGRVLATFGGETPEGPVSLVFVSAVGQRVRSVLDAARAIDPDVFYTVEMAREWSENLYGLPQTPDVRAIPKRK